MYYITARSSELSEEKTIELLKRRDDIGAVAELIELWQPLVTTIILRYGSNCDSEIKKDLRQAGNLGLIQAIGKYDKSKGKFSTIAYLYVRKQVQLAVLASFAIKIWNGKHREKYYNGIVSIDTQNFDTDVLESKNQSAAQLQDWNIKKNLCDEIIKWVSKNFSEKKTQMFIAAHIDGLTNKQINKKFGIATAGPQLVYIRKRVSQRFRNYSR